jgi:hypothetical protein
MRNGRVIRGSPVDGADWADTRGGVGSDACTPDAASTAVHDAYWYASGSWEAPLQAKLRALARLRQVADTGIAAAGNRADYRLIEMRDAFGWFEEQLDRHIQQRLR